MLTKLSKNVKVYETAPGCLMLHSTENKVIPGSDSQYVKSGVAISLPPGRVGILSSISMSFINNAILVHPGSNSIYPDKDDEILVLLSNEGRESFVVSKGAPIAILTIFRNEYIVIKEAYQ